MPIRNKIKTFKHYYFLDIPNNPDGKRYKVVKAKFNYQHFTDGTLA